MYLVFDTETNGLPGNYHLPATYLENWPRIVQLSWGIYDDQGNEQEIHNYIIKPDGFKVTEESSKIHGITHKMAHQEGHPIRYVLKQFRKSLLKVSYIVAHNLNFDIHVLGAECLRYHVRLSYRTIVREICTMKETTDYCQLHNTSGYSDYKWPRLEELYQKLFGRMFDNAHNALYDVRACAQCLCECIRQQIIVP